MIIIRVIFDTVVAVSYCRKLFFFLDLAACIAQLACKLNCIELRGVEITRSLSRVLLQKSYLYVKSVLQFASKTY